MIPSIAGIPGFLREPLSGLVDYSKSIARSETAVGRPNTEACGLFLFVAEDWRPGEGWAGKIRFFPVRNASKRQGGFVMDNEEVSVVMGQAMEARMAVAELVCMQRGWDENTPWTVAFFEHATAEVNKQERDLDCKFSPEQRSNMIMSYMNEEMLDMAQGWEKKAVDYLALGPVVGNPRLTAAEWLVVRGINVLAGIGHSHPSGDGDMSPEDFHHTAIVKAWQDMFQCRFPDKGQKKNSTLEMNRAVGSWIYALPDRAEIFNPAVAAVGANLNPGTLKDEIRVGRNAKPGAINDFRFYGHSTLTRYDTRGTRGSWRGPF